MGIETFETTKLGELMSWYPKSWVNWYLTFGHRSCIEIIATWKIRGEIQAPHADPHSPHSMWVGNQEWIAQGPQPLRPLRTSEKQCFLLAKCILQWHVYYIVIDSCTLW